MPGPACYALWDTEVCKGYTQVVHLYCQARNSYISPPHLEQPLNSLSTSFDRDLMFPL